MDGQQFNPQQSKDKSEANNSLLKQNIVPIEPIIFEKQEELSKMYVKSKQPTFVNDNNTDTKMMEINLEYDFEIQQPPLCESNQ